MTIQTPVVNAGFKYINGLNIAFNSGTKIDIAAGQCRDSTNANDMTLAATATINTAINGANGLDTGAMANTTLYHVYLIADSTKYQATAGLLSLSATAPLLPFGYDMIRRLGSVFSSGAAAVLAFNQYGSSSDRWMWYDAGFVELNAGASAAYATVDCATSVPLTATMINFRATITPTAADDKAVLRPLGATDANGFAQLSGVVAAKIQVAQIVVPCNAAASIEYKVTGTLSLATQAYLDILG